jgi:hypothetical protein
MRCRSGRTEPDCVMELLRGRIAIPWRGLHHSWHDCGVAWGKALAEVAYNRSAAGKSAGSEERQLRHLRFPLIATCCLLSCAPVNGINEDHRLPVVNAVLVTGQSTQSLTVMWAGTPDDPYPPDGPSAGDVNLWITSTLGDSTAVVHTDTTGVYAIALTLHAGATYRLRGTILGVSVAGNTTVPALAISAPGAGDTLRASVLDPHHFGLVQFPIDLIASGVGGYGIRSTEVIEGQQSYLTNLKAPVGVLFRGPASLPVHADITAFDSNAAAFYGVIQLDQPPTFPLLGGFIQTTLTGVAGLFGSSSSATLDVVIVP